jgi:hypothetical protein
MVSHCCTIDIDSKRINLWIGLPIFGDLFSQEMCLLRGTQNIYLPGAFLSLLFFNLKKIWPLVEQLYIKYFTNVVVLDGCELQVFLGLLSSFLPARFGWSPAWLLGSYPLTVYLVKSFRTSHMRKRTRIAHPIPLPVIQHSTLVCMILKVRIIKASLLAAALEGGGYSDPYVIVELSVPGKETQSRKTSVKFKTRCPVWNEEFAFELASTPSIRLAQITLTLMDKDLLKSDINGWVPSPDRPANESRVIRFTSPARPVQMFACYSLGFSTTCVPLWCILKPRT